MEGEDEVVVGGGSGWGREGGLMVVVEIVLEGVGGGVGGVGWGGV